MSTIRSKYKDQFILFLEAGFVAINQMDETSALAVFKAAKLLNPESILNEIGMGYLHLCKLEIKKAIHHFELALKVDPNNEMAKSFLGLSKIFSTDRVKEGLEILSSLKESHSKEVKHFSKSSLEFVDQYLKKSIHKWAKT